MATNDTAQRNRFSDTFGYASGRAATKVVGKMTPYVQEFIQNAPFAIQASADADGINVPFMMLASGDEPAEDVKKFEEALTVPKHVERFDDQIHGWMAARSDLSNERVKSEYERGYKTLLSFFGEHM